MTTRSRGAPAGEFGAALRRVPPVGRLAMRRFSCEACAAEIAFDSSRCPVCATPLGYVPDERTLRTLRPADAVTFRISDGDVDWWRCLNAVVGLQLADPSCVG